MGRVGKAVWRHCQIVLHKFSSGENNPNLIGVKKRCLYHLHSNNHLSVERRKAGAGAATGPGRANSWGDFSQKPLTANYWDLQTKSWEDFVIFTQTTHSRPSNMFLIKLRNSHTKCSKGPSRNMWVFLCGCPFLLTWVQYCWGCVIGPALFSFYLWNVLDKKLQSTRRKN